MSGQLVSLSANWNNELVPLTLTDGSVSFDITGKIVQLGMEGKTRTVSYEDILTTEEPYENGKTHYSYSVKKNDDGSFTVTEKPHDTWTKWYDREDYTASLKIPTDAVTTKGSYNTWKGTTVYYEDYKEPYVGVRYPGYAITVPTGGMGHVDESYYVPDWVRIEVSEDDETGYIDPEDGKKYKWIYTRDPETDKVIVFDENGDYYIETSEAYDYVYTSTRYVETAENEELEETFKKEVIDAMWAAGVNPDDFDIEFAVWYNEDGWVRGMYHITERQFWAEDIDGYGKAFEGKTADGWTVGYNRKGAACEKSIEMTGVDFFQSETAPSKVTVSWQSGKNMYNKTVWYISKISQEYANEIVTASFAQGGQWNGIKKEAK